jgi:hypothetical protein
MYSNNDNKNLANINIILTKLLSNYNLKKTK